MANVLRDKERSNTTFAHTYPNESPGFKSLCVVTTDSGVITEENKRTRKSWAFLSAACSLGPLCYFELQGGVTTVAHVDAQLATQAIEWSAKPSLGMISELSHNIHSESLVDKS